MLPRILIAALPLLLSARNLCAEITVTYQKIADESTPVPGWTGNFTTFGVPALSQGNVAFYGARQASGGQNGIYAWIDGELVRVADQNTPIPEGVGNFSGLIDGHFCIDGYSVIFRGSGSSQQSGLYLFVAETLQKVADKNTPIPGGAGNFTSLLSPSMDNGLLVFDGRGTNQAGLYLGNDQSLDMVVNQDTPASGGAGTLHKPTVPLISRGNVCFRAATTVDPSNFGVFTMIDGVLHFVADENTPMPPNGVPSQGFTHLSLDRDMIIAYDGGLQEVGIYAFVDDSILLIANQETEFGGGIGTFWQFWETAQSDGAVMFLCEGNSVTPDNDGLYVIRGGEFHPLARRNQLFDGLPAAGFGIGVKAMDGDQFAFLVGFATGGLSLDLAIYVGTIQVECVPGDLDGNGAVSVQDVPVFINAMFESRFITYEQRCAADADGSGVIDGADIQAFVDLLMQD